MENEKDVKNILYGPNLCILKMFKFDIFGTFDLQEIDELKKLSSTADMLDSFLNKLRTENNKEIQNSLIQCLTQDYDILQIQKNLTDVLTKEISNFLKSENSKYLKSIVTEFYSFTNLIDKLKKEIKLDKNDFYWFIPFLILAKRNFLNTLNLKISLQEMNNESDKFVLISKEINFSSAFFFVFINNLRLEFSENVIFNTKTNIFFSCVSNLNIRFNSRRVYFKLIKISRHIFFDLRKKKILVEYIKLMNIKLNQKNQFKGFEKIKYKIAKKEKLIMISKMKYLSRIKSLIDEACLEEKKANKLKDVLKKIQIIESLLKIFEIVHSLILYDDCKVHKPISNRLKYILKK